MIKLQVIGHLGSDCRVNQVNGKDVINFSVAHTESYKDNQGVKHDKTTWVDCNYWPSSTAIAPYLRKGTQVYVEGTPDIRTFEKKDGSQGASMQCRVFSVQLLGGNKQNGEQTAKQPAAADAPENGGGYRPVSQAEQGGAPAGTNDELPF